MGSDVPEHVKARWRGIRAYNKTRKRQKQKRRRRVHDLWSTGQYSRKEIAVLVGAAYSTIQTDIATIRAEMEKGEVCFLCGGPYHPLLNVRVASRSAAEHRRLADILEGKG